MDRPELTRLYPKLFHMADPEAWPGIARHGLLSTQALLDLYEVPEPQRRRLLGQHRPRSVPLSHPLHGAAVVRDQKPLHPGKLAACLTDGTTVEQWLQALNSNVFFWLQSERLERLLAARAYRNHDHLVVTVDTDRLLAAVPRDAVTLSRINSGATVFRAVPRGAATFQPIEQFPHPPRRRALASASDVAELCVAWGVPDIEAVADLAEIRGPSGPKVVWTRP